VDEPESDDESDADVDDDDDDDVPLLEVADDITDVAPKIKL
jgi:hypothetical protein